MIIKIKENFSNDYTTREAGERLRKMIVSSKEKVTLDFNGIKIASSSFFDEGIAKLLTNEGWNQQKFETMLTVINIYKMDEELLALVCKDRGFKK